MLGSLVSFFGSLEADTVTSPSQTSNPSNLVQQGVRARVYDVCHHWLLCDLTQVHLQVLAPGH